MVGYGVTLFLLAMIAALLAQLAIVQPVQKRKKTYVLVFILAFVIVSATILLVVTGAIRLRTEAHDGDSMNFSPLCSN